MPATASPSWRASASGLPQTRTGSRRRLVTSVFTSMGSVNDGTMRKPLWLIWLYRLFLFFKNHDFSVTRLAGIRKHSYGGVSFQGCLRLGDPEVSQGLLEVSNVETAAPALAGETGTIVATPFRPYRETTLVLRYETGDVVNSAGRAAHLPHAPSTCYQPVAGQARSFSAS